MGSPPPDPGPPFTPGVSVNASLPAAPTASLCGFTLSIPRFSIKFTIPGFPFPPPIPIPYISFKLSCDLNNPIDVTAGLKFGGGRSNNADPDPDLEEAA